MVSGRVLFNINGKKLDFHAIGVKKTIKKRKRKYEICKFVVSGALDDTKTIGKAGADIFAKFGAEKSSKNRKISKFRSNPLVNGEKMTENPEGILIVQVF